MLEMLLQLSHLEMSACLQLNKLEMQSDASNYTAWLVWTKSRGGFQLPQFANIPWLLQAQTKFDPNFVLCCKVAQLGIPYIYCRPSD